MYGPKLHDGKRAILTLINQLSLGDTPGRNEYDSKIVVVNIRHTIGPGTRGMCDVANIYIASVFARRILRVVQQTAYFAPSSSGFVAIVHGTIKERRSFHRVCKLGIPADCSV